MTEQEQTKQMLKTLCDKFQCSAIDRSYMAKSCRQCEDIIEALYEAGYGDISEYKAEREMLGSQIKVLKQRLNNKYVEIEQYKNNYDKAFEQIKAQEREIDKLREDNIYLKEELYELHDDLDIARAKKDKTIKQTQIDLLNKAKERLNSAPNGWAYTTYIDELIEEVENEQKD